MNTQELIASLGYAESPHFLTAPHFDEVPVFAHVFRRAEQRCALQGVYLLRDERAVASSATPIVYVAKAESREAADSIHRQVWNQSAVPFLIVHTPQGIRLYSGFAYQESAEKGGEAEPNQVGVLDSLIEFHEVTFRLAAFRAAQIDNGELWRRWGEKVQPEKRVDHRLLNNLEAIGKSLHAEGVPRESAHALIGKLVYLRYLRDREILSDRRLDAWNIRVEDVFGRQLEIPALQDLVDKIDGWLNGEIFPLSFREDSGLSPQQIERTAAVFLGDDALTDQLHLDFQAYDFSHIPIETLSSIYEQFLAVEGSNRESGAFYTPVPVVNFMIAEMEDHKPLEPGMRVLDPSCGSGAFLVQCYRHLIEKRMAKERRKLRPAELRDLLVRQIFGVDRDGDACRVAQMSLVLTMLDYIDPPDLQSTPQFKLPRLRDRNIYQGDFFDESSAWAADAGSNRYDWIIGNPPWVVQSVSKDETPLQKWSTHHKTTRPINRGQAAEAFAWKVLDSATMDGRIGLLLPAMTLFKQQAARKPGFRQAFFRSIADLTVANFTNLREILFSHRARLPSAAFFYGPLSSKEPSETVLAYSPFVVNQEANRPTGGSRRKTVWSLIPNSSEISFIDRSDALTGSSLPWKLAMWGTDRDRRLIERTRRRFQGLGSWAEVEGLSLGEGLQLRKAERVERSEPVTAIPEVVGKKRLMSSHARDVGHIHVLTDHFLEVIPPEEGFVRKGRQRPLEVCRPPHVIVSAARTFAVYSDEFIVVPPRQIGITGPSNQSLLLKALALYLSSDFPTYFEFFESPQWGIRDGRSTLQTLKTTPIPLAGLTDHDLKSWDELHRELAEASRKYLESPLRRKDGPPKELLDLEHQLNRKVEGLLGLSERESWLVHDLVHIRMSLTDGKLGDPAARRPSHTDLSGYAEMLRDELDTFIGRANGKAHRVAVYSGRHAGFVSLEMVGHRADAPIPIEIRQEDDPVSREIDRLREQQLDITRQWIYYDRNLFVYDRERTLILKPQQRLWWTRSQAMNDADEILSAALAPEDSTVSEPSYA